MADSGARHISSGSERYFEAALITLFATAVALFSLLEIQEFSLLRGPLCSLLLGGSAVLVGWAASLAACPDRLPVWLRIGVAAGTGPMLAATLAYLCDLAGLSWLYPALLVGLVLAVSWRAMLAR